MRDIKDKMMELVLLIKNLLLEIFLILLLYFLEMSDLINGEIDYFIDLVIEVMVIFYYWF